ncbi:MAG: hypothetical protein LBJ71_04350, partial [Holosporaceae bacterium]|nr:hypothetical protein [Holosporaceae bacterium]
MGECIKLVKDDDADPNTRVIFKIWAPKSEQKEDEPKEQRQRETLTLLEEAILSRFPEALEIFIAHGADIHTTSDEIRNELLGPEATLLHLALMAPNEMKALEGIRSVDRSDRLMKLAHSQDSMRKKISENRLAKFPIFIPLPQEEATASSPYVPRKVLELLLGKGLKLKLNAEDKHGKTILDWAIERFLALALNPEILTVDPQTPIANLKIPILNLQINESDQQMKKEYEDVVNWLFFDLEKIYNLKPTCKNENKEIYSLIIQLEGHEKEKEVLPPVIQKDLILKQ